MAIMKRITPRTCLWPLTGCLIATFALSIGLTFRSNHHCYAGTCGEWLFPFQARVHVVVWYLWASISASALAVRAFHPSIRRILSFQIGFDVPFRKRPLRLSGILVPLWISCLYAALFGTWWNPLDGYFAERGTNLPGNGILAAIAMTGHVADVTMGMVLLPVSRNSALASFFKLSPATTFMFHMVQAYVLFIMVVTHGILYASWVIISNQDSFRFHRIYPVLNPTYLFHEVWPGDHSSLGIWRASLIFTGIVSTVIMAAMFLTSFPVVRRKHFNLFYFTHLLGILAVIIICLHASTMLYCTLPGLSMWLIDWGMRVYELSGKLDSRIESLGKGWYSLTLPLPRKRLSGCACHSPLAHFYIHHFESSIREIHPFTTITYLASQKSLTDGLETMNVQFLFRKTGAGLSLSAGHTRQWTNKLASLVDEEAGRLPVDGKSISVASANDHASTRLRLEGPYFTLATPEIYENVLCLVAGTGLSGALAIAAAFHAQHAEVELPSCRQGPEKRSSLQKQPKKFTRVWKTCTVIWSVRESDYVHIPFLDTLICDGLTFKYHITGHGHQRLNMHAAIRNSCIKENTSDDTSVSGPDGRNTWVYLSGPNGFINSGEEALRAVPGIEWFAAKWD